MSTESSSDREQLFAAHRLELVRLALMSAEQQSDPEGAPHTASAGHRSRSSADMDNDPMDGAVFLGGGGSPDDECEVWRSAYVGVRRVLYWPFALTGDILGTADDWFRGALGSLGLGPEVVTWTNLASHSADELFSFDLLHVGGGNTFRLLDHIREHGFIEPVRQFVRHGGDYYGGSAGAVIACDDIEIARTHDPNDVGLADLSALSLIPAYSVLPHYDGVIDALSSWVLEHHRPLVAVPERGGIRYSEGVFTAIGPDPSTQLTPTGVNVRAPGASWRDAAGTPTADRAVRCAPSG